MGKIEIIQEIFQKTNFKTYLEIGCEQGVSFFPIRAKRKTAVDPCFQISTKRKLRWILREPGNLSNRYFEEESDTFFLKRKKYLEKIEPLDVVLIDGLHTFKASLEDVRNSLKYLNKDGIIIMHDCYPSNKPSSMPIKTDLEELKTLEDWTGEWCGDVWKTIVYLRRNMSELLDVCVLNTDFGLGIITLKGTVNTDDLIIDQESFLEIDQLTYEDLIQDPESVLNLKDAAYTSIIVDAVSKRGSD